MWEAGDAYEHYIGRWSRRVAAEFLRWLGRPGGRWIDVGCGSGALSAAVLAAAAPESVVGVDASAEFVRYTQANMGPRARFLVADARRLPLCEGIADTCAAGLVLNFVPDSGAAVAEMSRVTRRGRDGGRLRMGLRLRNAAHPVFLGRCHGARSPRGGTG